MSHHVCSAFPEYGVPDDDSYLTWIKAMTRGARSLFDVSAHIFSHNNCPPGRGFLLDWLEIGLDLPWRSFSSASGVGG
ncbi:hypothetical protein L484_016626 [Morus notabilis]|uniref:Uncharacterized protein n=1 Tax=Morus notabilis TaxID=981085 RepID=W9RXC6_9ROSA|nr:hypothetical protein L484_016626 [Morus notabilis]